MDKQSAQFVMNKLRARLDRSVPQAKLVYGRRLAPARGFSAGELDAAGLGVEQARSLGLATDEQRMSSLGVNVEALKIYLRR